MQYTENWIFLTAILFSPGTMIVYGECAEPILVAPDYPGEVFLAVAEYGAGRVAVWTHDAYAKAFLHDDKPQVKPSLSSHIT